MKIIDKKYVQPDIFDLMGGGGQCDESLSKQARHKAKGQA